MKRQLNVGPFVSLCMSYNLVLNIQCTTKHYVAIALFFHSLNENFISEEGKKVFDGSFYSVYLK